MRQITCTLNDTHRTTWTDNDALLKAGNLIRFKGETDFWKIIEVYEPEMDKCEINRTWKVGGL